MQRSVENTAREGLHQQFDQQLLPVQKSGYENSKIYLG
jgi:hypothetical protein